MNMECEGGASPLGQMTGQRSEGENNEDGNLEMNFEDHGVSTMSNELKTGKHMQNLLDLKERMKKNLAILSTKFAKMKMAKMKSKSTETGIKKQKPESKEALQRNNSPIVVPAGVNFEVNAHLRAQNNNTPIRVPVTVSWAGQPVSRYFIRNAGHQGQGRFVSISSGPIGQENNNHSSTVNKCQLTSNVQPQNIIHSRAASSFQQNYRTYGIPTNSQLINVRNNFQVPRIMKMTSPMGSNVSATLSKSSPHIGTMNLNQVHNQRLLVPTQLGFQNQQQRFPVEASPRKSILTPRLQLPTPQRFPAPTPQRLPVSAQRFPAPAPQRLPDPTSSRFSVSTPQRLPVPTPQRLLAPTPQRLLAPTPQRLPAPTPQRLPTPIPQRLPAAAPQRLLAPTPQRLLAPTPQRLPAPAPQRLLTPTPQNLLALKLPHRSILSAPFQQRSTLPVPTQKSSSVVTGILQRPGLGLVQKSPLSYFLPVPQNRFVSPPGPTNVTSTPMTNNPATDPNSGKTFPSLVVTVRPCLKAKELRSSCAKSRSELDATVKEILVSSPQKFTEWLMRRGLLRMNPKCAIHVDDTNSPYPYKLGMYTGEKHILSGGYVWVADCCGEGKELSVHHGSIFEMSVYTPVTVFKLLYHWACQTMANNVLHWTKVTNYYLKNFYTLIRSVCIASLQEMCPVMGGPQKFVEIGIITVGATHFIPTGDKTSKLQIMGVFDSCNKIIRMKVVNDEHAASRENRKQFLTQLTRWVDKSSIILIDSSMDKSLLEDVGFKNINQAPKIGGGPSKPSGPTNVNVMNYLKQIIPKMFHNVIFCLSKSLVQQFLDELSWRELWGGDPLRTFNSLLNHIVEITKWNAGESLINHLNKISLDPFGDWSYKRNLPQGIDMLPLGITGDDRDLKLIPNVAAGADKVLCTKEKPSSPNSYSKSLSPSSCSKSSSPSAPANKNHLVSSGLKRKFTTDLTPFLALEPKNYILQTYYYGKMEGKIEKSLGTYGGSLKCPLCMKTFVTSREIALHIYRHVMFGASRSNFKESCEYCFKHFPTTEFLDFHKHEVHNMSDDRYCCRICQLSFSGEGSWIIHMWENHDELEMPYICELCNFRSSMHVDVIDHFHKEHSSGDYIICQICLKTLTVRSCLCIKEVVNHFQSHSSRRNRHCPQCTLVFTTDKEYRNHITVDAAHRGRSRLESMPYELSSSEVACYMPKPPVLAKDKFSLPPPPAKRSRTGKSGQTTANSMETSLSTQTCKPIDINGKFKVALFDDVVEVYCDANAKCLECKSDLDAEEHFIGVMTCNKCSFATCCSVAINIHLNRCHTEANPNNIVPGFKLNSGKLLQTPLKCECGFASADPYVIAEHLVQCEQSVAYPDNPTDDIQVNSPPKE